MTRNNSAFFLNSNFLKRCISYELDNSTCLPQDFDRLLKGKEEILNTDYSCYQPEDIVADIQGKLGCFFQLKYISPENFKLRVYRISNWFNNHPRKESLVEELASFYIPPQAKCTLNRANLYGQQVFYCSSELITACEEFDLQYGNLFFISIWEFDGSGLTFSDYTFGQGGKYDSSSTYTEIKDKIALDVTEEQHKCMDFLHRFLAELFASNQDRFVARDRYLVPAAIAQKDMFNDNCAAVIYPSVKDLYKGTNYAIRADIAAKRLRPIKVLGCLYQGRVGIQSLRFDIKAHGDIRDIGKIEWKMFNNQKDTQLIEQILKMKFTPDQSQKSSSSI